MGALPEFSNGGFVQFFRQFWALRVVAFLIVARDFIRSLIRPCPNVDVSNKRTGQVCVLTGATKGIGIGIVTTLLKLDYTVICGVRNFSLMEKEVADIRKSGITGGHVKLVELDLKSLHSVKMFASQVLALPEARRIDMLLNHAGVYQHEYELTEDDLEVHFQVNYLSHFLLTELLLPRIKSTAKMKTHGVCHIVNTSSCLHYAGNLDFDNLTRRNDYVPIRGYFDTKLCQIVHVKSLQRQLEAEGIHNVQVYAAHPGAVLTDVWKDAYRGLLLEFLKLIFRQNAEEGADAILYPALSQTLSENCGGKYFESAKPISPNPLADVAEMQNKLHKISSKLVIPFKLNN